MRPHGTLGEVGCEIITEFPERFRSTKRVFLSPPVRSGQHRSRWPVRRPSRVTISRPDSRRIGGSRGHPQARRRDRPRRRREAARLARAGPGSVKPGSCRAADTIGTRSSGCALSRAEGEEIGTVAEILETGANDVYVVKGAAGERLIPAIKQVVKEIAPERGEMVVTLLPGM